MRTPYHRYLIETDNNQDLRRMPHCSLCRRRVKSVTAVTHDLPHAKCGLSGGRRELRLCSICRDVFNGGRPAKGASEANNGSV